MRNLKQKAFTMAEAILVMAILGIIATIMISTLRPAEFKERALLIAAKKVLNEIDNATTQILVNDSADGTMDKLYELETKNIFNFSFELHKAIELYKKYLVTTKKMRGDSQVGKWLSDDNYIFSYSMHFYLKNGAFVGISPRDTANQYKSIFPGETTQKYFVPEYGRIGFDVNGEKEPNVLGKDIFLIPIVKDGIGWDI